MELWAVLIGDNVRKKPTKTHKIALRLNLPRADQKHCLRQDDLQGVLPQERERDSRTGQER